MTNVTEKECAYILCNFKSIYADYKKMNKDSSDYKQTEKYIKEVLRVFSSIRHNKIIPVDPIVRGYKGNSREFYYDVIWLSYIVDKKYSSEEIVKILYQKHGLEISIIKLAKLKKKAINLFWRYMTLT